MNKFLRRGRSPLASIAIIAVLLLVLTAAAVSLSGQNVNPTSQAYVPQTTTVTGTVALSNPYCAGNYGSPSYIGCYTLVNTSTGLTYWLYPANANVYISPYVGKKVVVTGSASLISGKYLFGVLTITLAQ